MRRAAREACTARAQADGSPWSANFRVYSSYSVRRSLRFQAHKLYVLFWGCSYKLQRQFWGCIMGFEGSGAFRRLKSYSDGVSQGLRAILGLYHGV